MTVQKESQKSELCRPLRDHEDTKSSAAEQVRDGQSSIIVTRPPSCRSVDRMFFAQRTASMFSTMGNEYDKGPTTHSNTCYSRAKTCFTRAHPTLQYRRRGQ